jgi:hypothetical protein
LIDTTSLLRFRQFVSEYLREKHLLNVLQLPQFVSEMLQQGVRPDNRFAAKLISAFGHTQQYDKVRLKSTIHAPGANTRSAKDAQLSTAAAAAAAVVLTCVRAGTLIFP